jgi:hypothetical protein
METMSLEEASVFIADRGVPLATRGVRPCIDRGRDIEGLAYVLPALIEGSPAELLLDTGAQRTDVLLPSRVGRGLLPRSQPNKDAVFAASGKLMTRIVHSAHVRVGEWSMTTDVDIVPGQMDRTCPRDGVVSMDVLQSCVLVLGRDTFMGRCARRP